MCHQLSTFPSAKISIISIAAILIFASPFPVQADDEPKEEEAKNFVVGASYYNRPFGGLTIPHIPHTWPSSVGGYDGYGINGFGHGFGKIGASTNEGRVEEAEKENPMGIEHARHSNIGIWSPNFYSSNHFGYGNGIFGRLGFGFYPNRYPYGFGKSNFESPMETRIDASG